MSQLEKRTDWNLYYKNIFKFSKYTRKYTQNRIISSVFKYHNKNLKNKLEIAELGGANSCFFEAFVKNFSIGKYHIIDNNSFGLDLFKKQHFQNKIIKCFHDDVLLVDFKEKYDLVYSVGLIEHFPEEQTKIAILSHLKALKQDGLLIMTFPTPTLLYKISRKISEFFNKWPFFDERPLLFNEVESVLKPFGKILHKEILYPIIFTQGLIVFEFNKQPLA